MLKSGMQKRLCGGVMARSLGVGVFAMLLVSCATVPETGRHELLLIGADQEAQLGLGAANK